MIGAPVFRYVLTPGWAGDSLARAAQAVPSLDLNFAATKNVDPLVTFTRASSATYVGSDGLIKTATTNEPRFDHSPTTGESLGLLVEEQRTNSLPRSEEFDNASWINQSTTETIDASISTPTGGSNAYRLIDNSSNVSHNIYQATTIAGGTATTLSVYARQATLRYIRLSATVSGTDYAVADFDLQTGTVTQTGNGATGTVSNATAQSVGNGWIRCSAVFNTSGGNRSITFHTLNSGTMPISGFGVSPYIGVGGYVHIWGAQLEAGAFPTSYIPTTAAAATRSADVANNTTVGSNIRSLFAQFRSPASGTRPVVSLDDNTANERIEILTSGTDPKLLVTDGGGTVADLNGGTVTANVTARAAAVFDTNNYVFSVNGGASQLDSSGALPTVNRIRIGSNQAGGYLNGTIARATGWDTALANLPPITQ